MEMSINTVYPKASVQRIRIDLEVEEPNTPANVCSHERSWLVEESRVRQLLHVHRGCWRWRGSLLGDFHLSYALGFQVGVLLDHLLNLCT